jgi:S-formylglutathione hydrolase FrmB
LSVAIQNRTYWSQALGREQAYVCLLPEEAAGSPTEGRRYPLLVLLHGLGGGPADWVTNTRLARYLAAYDLIAACPDGASGWYTNAFDGSARYEDDLIQEFLPHLQATLPLQPPGKAWGIGGLSMGGYGAVKLALKHPKLFSVAVSHSGAFALPMVKAAHPVFGDPKADLRLRKAENVFALAELALCRFPTERPRLWLDCGTEDELLGSSRRFKDHLAFIGYPHTYREMPGYHTWPYWDRAFRTALPEIAEGLGADSVQRSSQ